MFMLLLDSILDDLQKYKRNKKDLLVYYTNERLEKSLKSYYSLIKKSEYYLSYNTQMKDKVLLKKVTKGG